MRQYAKAVVAALVAGLGAVGTALADGSVAPIEWVGVTSATLVALGAVWTIPNADPDPDAAVAALADRDRRAQREDLAERLHPGEHRRVHRANIEPDLGIEDDPPI